MPGIIKESLSIVLIAHNEETVIGKVLEGLLANYRDKMLELVVVDDASTDGTSAVVEAIRKSEPKVRLVRREGPCGVGRAIKTGFASVSPAATHVLTMDSDFAESIGCASGLIKRMEQGDCDGVIGSRFITGSRLEGYPITKKIMNRLFHYAARILFGIKQKDLSNNFKIFKREIIEKMPWHSDDFAINAETGILPILSGYKICEVPVSWIGRGEGMGKSKFKLLKAGMGYIKVIPYAWSLRKKVVKILAIALVAAILPLSAVILAHSDEISSGSVRELSLKDSINIAFLNNKDIQIQAEELDVAKAGILGAKSAFWPKLSAQYGYTYNGYAFNLGSLPINSKKDPGIFTGYANDNKVGLAVNESIYNGGADIATLKESRLNMKAQEEGLRARKLDTAFETKRLYYGLLLAYETQRIAEALLHESQAHYDDVKAKFEQGSSSKFDVLQSSVQVSKIVPEVIKAKNAIQIILAEFKKVLGIGMDEEIKPTGHLAYTPAVVEESSSLKEAYKRNPEMIVKILGIDINKWEIEYAKSGYYPQVDASFGYNYRSNNMQTIFDYRHTNWSAGITVGLSIFDGMSTKSKVDAAKAKYGQARLSKENFSDQLAVDVKTACLDMKEADAIVKSQRDAIVEAKEALKISEIGYDNGVTTNLDVLDSQVSLSQVEKNLAEGIYDYLIAQAQLDKLVGRESYSEEK
jgi:outer membrane protein TolC